MTAITPVSFGISTPDELTKRVADALLGGEALGELIATARSEDGFSPVDVDGIVDASRALYGVSQSARLGTGIGAELLISSGAVATADELASRLGVDKSTLSRLRSAGRTVIAFGQIPPGITATEILTGMSQNSKAIRGVVETVSKSGKVRKADLAKLVREVRAGVSAQREAEAKAKAKREAETAKRAADKAAGTATAQREPRPASDPSDAPQAAKVGDGLAKLFDLAVWVESHRALLPDMTTSQRSKAIDAATRVLAALQAEDAPTE